jgi:hypothetical protein
VNRAEFTRIIKKLDEVERQINKTVSKGLKEIEELRISTNNFNSNFITQLKSDIIDIWSFLWRKNRR